VTATHQCWQKNLKKKNAKKEEKNQTNYPDSKTHPELEANQRTTLGPWPCCKNFQLCKKKPEIAKNYEKVYKKIYKNKNPRKNDAHTHPTLDSSCPKEAINPNRSPMMTRSLTFGFSAMRSPPATTPQNLWKNL
jgi:hypothetical protein